MDVTAITGATAVAEATTKVGMEAEAVIMGVDKEEIMAATVEAGKAEVMGGRQL